MRDEQSTDDNGRDVRHLLQVLASQARPAPIDADRLAGRVARRRSVRLAVTSGALTALVAAGTVAVISVTTARVQNGGLAAGSPTETSQHGAFTDREFQAAVTAARAEAAKDATAVTRATATIGEGTVSNGNTGLSCLSGRLLHIRLIGSFNIVYGGVPSESSTHAEVTTVQLTTDAATGETCEVMVQTAPAEPDTDAVLLFTG